jgi:PII-like signaling protein
MRFSGEGKLLRIFIGESDHYDGKPLYQALVERARSEGLAGATVIRGIEGYGASSHVHTSRILRLSEDLPIIIEIVDTAENVERILPMVDEMVGDGMVTVERVEVLTYRAQGRKSEQVVDRLRMLAEEARSLAASPEKENLLSASVRAAHEYGASEKQIVEVSSLPVADVRRIIQARPEDDEVGQ